MKFQEYISVLAKLENLASRNEMTELLAELIGSLDPEDIEPAMYLLQGRLVPQYVDIEFGVSEKLALQALEQVGAAVDVNELMKDLGDVGLVAEQINDNHNSELSIVEVHARLLEIAKFAGSGSQQQKIDAIAALITEVSKLESRYIMRVIIGKLRLGLSDKTILDALSWSQIGSKKLRKNIERAYGARADLGFIARIIIETETDQLAARLGEIEIVAGVPVASKLVAREKNPEAVFERLGPCILQPKLDGLRAQIHLDGDGEPHIYSRNMENMTHMFPDLCAAVRKLGVESIIIDSEAIGYDFDNQTYLPYQTTMQRSRKHNIAESAEQIPIRAMCFDLLFLNGEDWSRRTTEQRLNKLTEIINAANSDQQNLALLENEVVETSDHLSSYFYEIIGMGLEGVIAKTKGSIYEPGTRNYEWIKLKANTQSNMVDTVDGVVVGYYLGRGDRAKHGIGALLLAVYDQQQDKYLTVAKVGSGIKDEDWQRIVDDLQPLHVDSQPQNLEVSNILKPDQWIQPQIVAEVMADEITRSPAHTAAIGRKADFEQSTPEKGLSLRFPRLQVWNRDKQPQQATTVTELLTMFELRS